MPSIFFGGGYQTIEICGHFEGFPLITMQRWLPKLSEICRFFFKLQKNRGEIISGKESSFRPFIGAPFHPTYNNRLGAHFSEFIC